MFSGKRVYVGQRIPWNNNILCLEDLFSSGKKDMMIVKKVKITLPKEAYMTGRVFTENAVISSKGQITVPKEIRQILGVNNGEKITFIVIGNEVRIVNAAAYAMKVLQTEMIDEAAKAGFESEDDIVSFIKELRGGKK